MDGDFVCDRKEYNIGIRGFGDGKIRVGTFDGVYFFSRVRGSVREGKGVGGERRRDEIFIFKMRKLVF